MSPSSRIQYRIKANKYVIILFPNEIEKGLFDPKSNHSQKISPVFGARIRRMLMNE